MGSISVILFDSSHKASFSFDVLLEGRSDIRLPKSLKFSVAAGHQVEKMDDDSLKSNWQNVDWHFAGWTDQQKNNFVKSR